MQQQYVQAKQQNIIDPDQETYRYQSPLGQRYASKQMNTIFSAQTKHTTWRRLWVELAQAEKELGLPITQEQIDELKAHMHDIDFAAAEQYERKLRHDVMAHIHAYGDQCPQARAIIHLGATSCLITDNADLIIMRDALKLIEQKLVTVIRQLATHADRYKSLPCLSFTHMQPAQPTTVGKRFCMWLQDFLLDLEELNHRVERLRFLGIKGATGTQASFLQLFDGDHEKVIKLEQLIAQRLGFNKLFSVSGQTYTRKQDAQILDLLAGIATSAHKMSTDLRLLAYMKEIEEPFEHHQVGSSAMPYKRNPMRNERICSLARYVMSLSENPKYTAATQWFERTLDDSANRRLCIPEAFLATDGILNLLINITHSMVVYPKVIEKNLQQELPFMATENILMACVKKGADRQAIHEILRQHSIEVGRAIKEDGAANDLLQRLAADPAIPCDETELNKLVNAEQFIGRAPEQVEGFLAGEVWPVLKQYDGTAQQVEICY